MSNVYCSVYGCKSIQKKDRNLSFHAFPKSGQWQVEVKNKYGRTEKLDKLKAWNLKLKNGKPVSRFMKVCSLHFDENDYHYRESNSKKRKCLKLNAVPSRNLPSGEKISTRQSRRLGYKSQPEPTSSKFVEKCEEQSTETSNDENEGDNKFISSQISLIPEDKELVQTKDMEVQVNTYKPSNLCDIINTKKTLNSFTGLSSFELLDVIVSLVQQIHSDARSHKLDIRERIILTFTKLKTDMTYRLLSNLFNIAPNLCKCYIEDMLPIISKALEHAIDFPSREEISRNIPKCFTDFPNVRIILDCTEIFIQNLKCLCCRIRFFSYYKGHNTIKYMVGVSPAGLITYISEPYGGRASDKCIFENCSLLEMLESGDGIMVDKGFLIEDICSKLNLKLYRPPFLKGKSQLSAEEASYNVKIAAARVHVERVNQRIKQFKILCGKIHWSLIPHMKHIFQIICAVTNLSNPILSRDKFV